MPGTGIERRPAACQADVLTLHYRASHYISVLSLLSVYYYYCKRRLRLLLLTKCTVILGIKTIASNSLQRAFRCLHFVFLSVMLDFF